MSNVERLDHPIWLTGASSTVARCSLLQPKSSVHVTWFSILMSGFITMDMYRNGMVS